MGTWGYRVFEDDVALDLVEDWMEADAPEQSIAHALCVALSRPELEYDDGQAIIVATAILDYALVGTEPDDDSDLDGFQVWLDSLSRNSLRSMLPLALPALGKLLGPHSALDRLWQEKRTLHAPWREQFIQRRARLSQLMEAVMPP